MEKYLGVKLIEAEPEYKPGLRHEDDGGDLKGDGYKVIYEDGYTSWSPKDILEKTYRRIDNLTFGLAIEALKQGKLVARKGWNGRGIFIELQVPDKNSKMTHPYIFIDTTGLQTDNKDAPKDRVPWQASQTDMLAEDWLVVE